MPIFAIHLGNTRSSIAKMDRNTQVKVIRNPYDGLDTLDSVIYFDENEESVIVGREAKSIKEFEPERVADFFVNQLGNSDAKTYSWHEREYSPIELSAIILKRLKKFVEEQGDEVRDVVITCPTCFGTENRITLKQAGELAGFNVLSIVCETMASAVRYSDVLGKSNDESTYLIYNLGGSIFSVSIVKVSFGKKRISEIRILSSDGDRNLGGKDWDDCITTYILEQAAEVFGIVADDDSDEKYFDMKNEISAKAEEIKIHLSHRLVKDFLFRHDRNRHRIQVTRRIFELLTMHLCERSVVILDELLNHANANYKVTEDDIDKVLLVGGSTYMLMISDAVKSRFGDERVIMLEPHLAITKGAAIYAYHFVDHDLIPPPCSKFNYIFR